MSMVDKLKSAIGLDDDSRTGFTQYRCEDCDHEFESAKRPSRVSCPECVGQNVAPVEES